MRKYLVAAVAALTVVGGTTAALAQTGSDASMKVSVSPSKAGTKKKPKGTKLHLFFSNHNHALTATQIKILLAKNVKVNTKGLKFCSASKIQDTGGHGCSSKSKVGSGTSHAIAGVNTKSPTPLTFAVTAFLISKSKVGFFLQQQGGSITTVAIGTFGKAGGKYGSKLVVAIPQVAKEFPTGTFNGLVDLTTTLGKKVGKHNLVGLTGCPKSKKLPFSTTVTFEPNPGPPSTPSVTATATAKCKR